MDIWEVDKLVLFIAFVVPGFISLKTYALLQPTQVKDTSQQLIDAIAYSSVNYALLIGPIYAVEQLELSISHPVLYMLFYMAVLLIAPIGWAWGFLWLRKTKLLQRSVVHPTGKPWDFVFNQRLCYWVVATLSDGRQIGGYYGPESFASNNPEPEQIFLEQSWVLNDDGGFERVKTDTAGIIILAKEIVTLELFQVVYPKECENDEQTK
ncbi:hypothetical protein I4N56_014255 [Pseudomonas mohnii]|uniref:DUF6338 family protein n=1 Tax=Pseudomonas mohnii TaxID=395600 RepID=UPI0018DD1F98|nr:DUF6338 family protein [Pseudomonas mohnii]MBH8611962.1 hypothetical protein [Pseudomonas mohnii]